MAPGCKLWALCIYSGDVVVRVKRSPGTPTFREITLDGMTRGSSDWVPVPRSLPPVAAMQQGLPYPRPLCALELISVPRHQAKF